MKQTLSTIRDWFQRNKSTIIDTMITILSTLGMISFTIVATTAVVVVVAGAWMGAGGNPEHEALLFTIAISLVGFYVMLVVILRTESRYRRRRAESAPQDDDATVGRRAAVLWRDYDDETMAIVIEHEARHAIIADALGYTVTEIRTRKGLLDSDGHVLSEEPKGLTLTEQRWNQTLIALAPLGAAKAVMQQDNLKVLSLLMHIVMEGEKVPGVSVPLTLPDLLAEAIDVTRQLVEENQAAIDKLVAELNERRVLGRKEISELFPLIRSAIAGPLPGTSRKDEVEDLAAELLNDNRP